MLIIAISAAASAGAGDGEDRISRLINILKEFIALWRRGLCTAGCGDGRLVWLIFQ